MGQPLTATAGTWDGGVTLAYQWTADGTDIGGATASSYTPVAGDVGKVLTVKVTGSKTGYTTVTKESQPTTAVAKGDLALTPIPTISGTPQFGATLLANAGTWDTGTALGYQWLVDGIPVDGAVGPSYVVRAGDVGKTVTVAVTGSKPGYNSVTRTSAGTTAVTARALCDDQCTVDLTGRAKVGKKLKARVDDCPAGATIHYAWYAGGKLIRGADAATHKLKRKQAGKRIKVLVSISAPGYVGSHAGQPSRPGRCAERGSRRSQSDPHSGEPQQRPGLAGGHRRALGDPAGVDGAVDELPVGLDRDALADGQHVLHADPQVAALGQRGEHHAQSVRAADAGGRPRRDGVGQGRDAGDQRGRGAGHAARDAHHEVDVHLAAVRQAVAVQQPAAARPRGPRSNSSNSGTTWRSWLSW